MIANSLISIAIWFLQNTILKILPNEFAFLSFSSFQSGLNNIKPDLIGAFSGVNQFLPVNLLLVIILIIITGEILLFGIKAMFWVINIIRGAGA